MSRYISKCRLISLTINFCLFLNLFNLLIVLFFFLVMVCVKQRDQILIVDKDGVQLSKLLILFCHWVKYNNEFVAFRRQNRKKKKKKKKKKKSNEKKISKEEAKVKLGVIWKESGKRWSEGSLWDRFRVRGRGEEGEEEESSKEQSFFLHFRFKILKEKINAVSG